MISPPLPLPERVAPGRSRNKSPPQLAATGLRKVLLSALLDRCSSRRRMTSCRPRADLWKVPIVRFGPTALLAAEYEFMASVETGGFLRAGRLPVARQWSTRRFTAPLMTDTRGRRGIAVTGFVLSLAGSLHDQGTRTSSRRDGLRRAAWIVRSCTTDSCTCRGREPKRRGLPPCVCVSVLLL